MLLDLRNSTQLEAHPLPGNMFENYMIAELAKAYLHSRRTAPIYFWHGQSGHEVDLLIEEENTLWPVEFKSGQTFSPSMVDRLNWRSRLAGEPIHHATLICGGGENREWKGITVRPWFAV